MQIENRTKKSLLKEIELLLSYNPSQTTTINPNYLEYLEIKDLETIKDNLIVKVGKLKEEDIAWLQQFKKEIQL
jgi:hypothetical protein